MKAILATLITSTLLAGIACAQSPTPPADPVSSTDTSPHTMMRSDSERNADVQKHITDMHAKLGITPSEESLWSVVATTMTNNANDLDKAIDQRDAMDATAIDDLNAYGAVVQAHADGIKKLSAAFSSLYASMPDDQKKVADEIFAQRAHEGKNEPQAMK
jgi:protein CpxP